MYLKELLLFCVALHSIETSNTERNENARMVEDCPYLCGRLTQRFKGKDVFNKYKAEAEMKIICQEDFADSRALCRDFKLQAPKIAVLAESSSLRKICRSVCTPASAPSSHETQAENDTKRCWRCKDKVATAARIAKLLDISLSGVVDIICPRLLAPDIGSRVLCKKITKKIAASTSVSEQVAQRICSAMKFCMPLTIPSDECVLTNATRRASAFETAIRIGTAISESMRDQHDIQQISQQNTSLLILDETAKCLPYQSGSSTRKLRQSRTVKACKLCGSVAEAVERSLNRDMNSLHATREKFSEFCHSIKDNTTAIRCLVLYEAINSKGLLKTVFQKEVCEQLNCDLYVRYPVWRCSLCKINVLQQPIRGAIEAALKTIADIKKGVAVLCNMRKDHRCEEFLSIHRNFLDSISNIVRKDKVCSYIGLCKA